LGDNNINIADFRLGRNKKGALAVIIVDDNINETILEKLRNLKAAKAVYFVNI
jgi:D-3-phosphoglycerate dehydrogenase